MYIYPRVALRNLGGCVCLLLCLTGCFLDARGGKYTYLRRTLHIAFWAAAFPHIPNHFSCFLPFLLVRSAAIGSYESPTKTCPPQFNATTGQAGEAEASSPSASIPTVTTLSTVYVQEFLKGHSCQCTSCNSNMLSNTSKRSLIKLWISTKQSSRKSRSQI